MEKRSARIYASIGAAMGWFAIIVQFYLHMQNSPVPVAEKILRFFGYFTIDTNILCALFLTFIALQSNSPIGRFFKKATTATALTVYITIVGITYNILLRNTWNPQGMQKLVDELLHSVIPVYFVLFWFIFVPSKDLQWKNTFSWLTYPILYMVYSIIFGAITKFYPYPFVDVNELGYSKALTNSLIVLALIFLLSLALIGIGKMRKKFSIGANR